MCSILSDRLIDLNKNIIAAMSTFHLFLSNVLIITVLFIYNIYDALIFGSLNTVQPVLSKHLRDNQKVLA